MENIPDDQKINDKPFKTAFDEPLYYANLSLSAKSNKIEEQRIQKKNSGKALQWISWVIIPVLVLGVMILDGCEIYKLTTERIIVFTIGLIIVFAPFIREIKIGDYSLSLHGPEKLNHKKGHQGQSRETRQ